MIECDFDKAVCAVANGNVSKMEILYKNLMKPVFLLAYSIVRNYEIAEDIMQETFIKVQSKADSYMAGTNAKAWIFQIARNLSYNAIKKQTEFSIEDYSELIKTEDMYDNTENSVDLNRALSILDEIEREIVVMHVLAGLKHKEIASILQIDASTVRKRYSKSISKLYKFLSR